MFQPHRIVIIGCSVSDKTDVLLNLIKHQQPGIDKFICMSKIHSIACQQKRKSRGRKELKNPKAFINYSQKIDNICKNLVESEQSITK